MKHVGPARTFDSMEACLEGLETGKVKAGEVIVLRYEGPRGGPGLTEVFKVLGYMGALGLDKSCALVTDGKISGFAKGPFICQVSPEAASRRPDRPRARRRPDRGGHPGAPVESPGLARRHRGPPSLVDPPISSCASRDSEPVCSSRGGPRNAAAVCRYDSTVDPPTKA